MIPADFISKLERDGINPDYVIVDGALDAERLLESILRIEIDKLKSDGKTTLYIHDRGEEDSSQGG